MLHWHCVCDAGNGVAVSVNDIIIKLVATTLKVSTVHRLLIEHVHRKLYNMHTSLVWLFNQWMQVQFSFLGSLVASSGRVDNEVGKHITQAS